MKIITWNVNSIRQRLPRVLALLHRHQPDALCLQETKVTDEAFPHSELEAAGYRAAVFGQKSYNGVALVARDEPADVIRGFPGDPVPGEARAIAARIGALALVNAYVVNGKEVGDPAYETKLRWLDAFDAWLRDAFDPGDALLVVGDFNIAPADPDIYDPDAWRGRNLASEPERGRVRALLDWGLTDLGRRAAGDVPGPYTFWDYRSGAFHRGWGLRIDLALGTAPVAARLVSVEVDREERKESSGEGKPSDHAPVIVTLSD